METALIMLKMDLGITHDKRDILFNKLLASSVQVLKERGITLDFEQAADQMLLSDYVAWCYRNRNEDRPLSNNLTYRIRNRQVRGRCGSV